MFGWALAGAWALGVCAGERCLRVGRFRSGAPMGEECKSWGGESQGGPAGPTAAPGRTNEGRTAGDPAAFLGGYRVNELGVPSGKSGWVPLFEISFCIYKKNQSGSLPSPSPSPLSPLRACAPLSMQIGFLSTAHAINSHFSTGSRRHTSAPVGNRSSAPVPSTSTPPPEASWRASVKLQPASNNHLR